MTTALAFAAADAAAEVTRATGAASLIWLCVLVPLASSGLLLVLGKASDAWGHWLAIAASAASFAIGAAAWIAMLGRKPESRVMETVLYRWIPGGGLQVDFGFRVDRKSVV